MVVSFTEKEDKLSLKNFAFFEKLVRDSFRFKRKNIKNNLNNYDLKIVESVLSEFGYDLTVRAEMLGVEVFVKLANALFK